MDQNVEWFLCIVITDIISNEKRKETEISMRKNKAEKKLREEQNDKGEGYEKQETSVQ